jgi:flavodoxin
MRDGDLMRVLTVYVTRTGNTERVARKVYETLGGDIELITEKVNRKGIIGWIRTGRQNAQKEAAEIDPTEYDPSEYDLVILASPVWAGSVSAPMRGYMTLNAGKLTRTAVFLTHDSGDVGDAFTEIREILSNSPEVEGSLQRSNAKDEFDSTVSTFIDRISELIPSD